MESMVSEDKNKFVHDIIKTENCIRLFNTKTGEITKYDEMLYWSYNNWYYILSILYPVYENNVYIGYYDKNIFHTPGDR